MTSSRQIEHAARFEILKRDAVAVNENDNRSRPTVDIVKSDAVYLDECADRRRLGFGAPRA